MFNLSINNYRSFLKQDLKFSRINILIGENSGGKSSLLKLLLALKQTIESPLEGNLKLTGYYTDLGNYEEVVYYRKKNRKISIGFEDTGKYFDYFLEFLDEMEVDASSSKLKSITKIVDAFKDTTTSIEFEFSSKLSDHSTINTVIKNSKIGDLEIVQKKGKEEHHNRQIIVDLVFDFGEEKGKIETCYAIKEGFFTLLTPELEISCRKKYGDKVYYKIVYLLVMQNYIQDEIAKIRFVNPITNSPKRLYFQEDKKSAYKTIDIEKFINIISDKSLSPKGYQNRIDHLNKALKEFGIADEIEIKREKQLPVMALNVKTKDFWSNITDVGYGVSLQIPILFQAILSEHYTKKGQTLLIEQPEVHLHPSLQAKFIETLLSIGNKNVYFIETHSEHIIRKLQVLVKNKKFGLKPEDISIHYFKREPLKFDISSHSITDDGKLSPSFPSGFYDTSYSLVKELM